MLKRYLTPAKSYAKLSLPLILITVAIYLCGVSAWDASARLRGTEDAATWLAGLVTVVLAIAAGLGWAFHDRRTRLIELSEMFASVHAVVTTPELLRLIDRGAENHDGVDQQVLRETFLRNSSRIDIIQTHEAAILTTARERLDSKAAPDPFQKLFNKVSESLSRLESVLPDDDPAVVAQKEENRRTFGQTHAKNPAVQQLYRRLAESLAGGVIEPGQSGDVTTPGMPYRHVRLSTGQQGIELFNRNAAGDVEDRVWIAGSGAGDLLGSGCEHRDRVDAASGKKLPCDFTRGATRARIVESARARAGQDAVDGPHLRDALVSYFGSLEGFATETTCPSCLRLVTLNLSRKDAANATAQPHG